jgi:hypothetical protein
VPAIEPTTRSGNSTPSTKVSFCHLQSLFLKSRIDQIGIIENRAQCISPGGVLSMTKVPSL